MTEAARSSQPRTSEGLAARDFLLYHNSECRVLDDFEAVTNLVLRIEAEAAQQRGGLDVGLLRYLLDHWGVGAMKREGILADYAELSAAPQPSTERRRAVPPADPSLCRVCGSQIENPGMSREAAESREAEALPGSLDHKRLAKALEAIWPHMERDGHFDLNIAAIAVATAYEGFFLQASSDTGSAGADE